MKVINVAMNLIDEDLEQPRYNFNENSLKELAESISEVGLLNPIKVRQLENGRYKIVFGNRRYKACKLLNFTEVPSIISEGVSELDIYLEQLTENIQRESFTAIEEAEAFERLLNDNKFRISKILLSNRLGKAERYISQKLDLLVFSKRVQQIIHGSKDIIQDKLTEEQVLPLKNVSAEYRDALAIKVASEQVPVKDVKRISELFLAKDISDKSKEYLLNKPSHQLLNDWSDYDRERKENRAKIELESSTTKKVDVFNNSFVQEDYSSIKVVQSLHNLLKSIPSQHETSEEVLVSINEIKIRNRQEFILTVDAVVDCLEGHVRSWKKIRKEAGNTKFGIVK